MIEEMESVLAQTAKSVRSFCALFASSIRREFYHASFVWQFWRERQFPMLVHAVEQLLDVGFAVTHTSPVQDSQQAGNTFSPKIVRDQVVKEDCLYHLYFAAIVSEQLEELRKCFQKDVSYPTDQVLVEITMWLRAVQLTLNNLIYTIDAWLECIDGNQRSDKNRTVYALEMPYWEANRTYCGRAVQWAKLAVAENENVLTLCLLTRHAALSGIYELCTGLMTKTAIGDPMPPMLQSVIQLHQVVVELFQSLEAKIKEAPLFQLARDSISWRMEQLLNPDQLERYGVSMKTFSPTEARICAIHSPAPHRWFELDDITVFVKSRNAKRNAESKSFLHGYFKLVDSEVDADVIVGLDANTICIKGSIGKQLVISTPFEEIDSPFACALKLCFVRVLAGMNRGLAFASFEMELQKRRLLSILDFVHSQLLLRNSDSLYQKNQARILKVGKLIDMSAEMLDQQYVNSNLLRSMASERAAAASCLPNAKVSLSKINDFLDGQTDVPPTYPELVSALMENSVISDRVMKAIQSEYPSNALRGRSQRASLEKKSRSDLRFLQEFHGAEQLSSGDFSAHHFEAIIASLTS